MSLLTQEEYNKWWQVNRKSLPFIFIGPILILVINCILLFQGESLEEVFDTYAIIGLIEFAWIPFFTINAVHLGSIISNRTTLAFGWQMGIKLLFCLAGVLTATWMIEELYASNDIYDDDIIVLGELTLSPATTNYVTNAAIAIAIAIPVLFNQERKKRLENRLEARRLEVERLEKLKALSRLEALQSKLNPHFLYNALNTLAGLVYTNPAKAEEVIIGLSELFRYNLRNDERQLVSLEEELDVVKAYLSVEMIRFDKMLQYSIEADAQSLKRQVPRFLLQPLVENAVKHGTSKMTDGRITIRAAIDQHQKLNISIEDNGAPFPEDIRLGFGLGSTIEKLQLLFPGTHEIRWENAPVKRILITLGISPFCTQLKQ